MSLRILFLFVFSVLLNAQQNTISLELDSTSFPKGCVFKVELESKFSVIDTKKMLAEGRRAVSDKDYLLKQTSKNSSNWTISYDNDGNPIIKGSPQSMVFDFPKPIDLSSDVACHIMFEGRLQLKGGKKVVETPFQFRYQLRPDDTYVFRLVHKGSKDGQVLFSYSLLTKKMLQDMLEGKITTNTESRQGTRSIIMPSKPK